MNTETGETQDYLTETEKFWNGEFGDEYTERNTPDVAKRVEFFGPIMRRIEPFSVFEVGCNKGCNLDALKELRVPVRNGCDINPLALQEAHRKGHAVYAMRAGDLTLSGFGHFDLVMTVGVLIHIHPADLDRVLDDIIAVSNRYVLAVEYGDHEEVEVDYRGHTGRLWRRPYGKLLEAKGLTRIETGHAGEGFDNCHYWLMEKPQA